MSLEVKLSLAEHFLNWYPSNTKLYIRGQRGKGWAEQRALDKELFDQLCAFFDRYVPKGMTDEELRERMLSWRGILPGDECPTCGGAGTRAYGSTATWRGGVGGQMITTSVCDKCWGSGDRHRPGANLRKIANERQTKAQE